MLEITISALVLGLISSFHCVGMCGPLALALPVAHLGKGSQMVSLALYNLGRVITYGSLGLVFGLAGRKLYLAGFQQWFSIGAGLLMLVLAFQYFIRKRSVQPVWLNGFHRQVQTWMQRSLQSKHLSGYLFLGMANGLLPCGMVYLAIAGALTTTQVYQGVLFMVYFGAGTLPAMMALGMFGLRADLNVRRRIKQAMPFVVAGVALLLILRGLNLGIPFISPHLSGPITDAASCH